MFELFIALFGGLFWGGKYCIEKSETKKLNSDFESTMEARKLRAQEFENKVIDWELEADLENFIYDISNYDKVWEEVSKAFDEMPWKSDDEKYLCLCPEAVEATFGKGSFSKKERENIAAACRMEALRIMLANRGKLRHSDAYFGIRTTEGAPTVRICEQWNRETANFVLWINQKLKEHGINESVLLENTHLHCWFPITEENKHLSGTYYWCPTIIKTINIKNSLKDI